ncbi:MAG: glycine dehydrogenase, partial [Candidatus Omnitrophica bacterium]|nr:glycine dehydrogenase [Candidatus Omnitrophota bacterium]
MSYIPHTKDDISEMLQVIGVSGIDDLFRDIPAALKPRSFDIPPGKSEA